MDAIHSFRTQHEKLRAVVTEVLMGEQSKENTNVQSRVLDSIASSKDGFSATNAIRDVEGAPISVFATIDVLELSPKGIVAFSASLEGYERKIDAIEERLAKLLRDKLTACKVRVYVYDCPNHTFASQQLSYNRMQKTCSLSSLVSIHFSQELGFTMQ